MSNSRSWFLVVALLVAFGDARGESRPSHPQTLGYDNFFAVRVNPLGLADDFRLRYRIGLYDSPRPLLAQSFVGVVTPLLMSPALAQPGLGIEVQPLSLLHFYVGYEPGLYFGAVGSLHSYTTPTANVAYGPVQLGGPPFMPGDLYRTVVHHVVMAVTAQFAWRQLAFRSMWRAIYVDAALRSGDTVFWEPLYAVLLPRTGWMIFGETAALYRFRFGFSAGLQYNLTATWYPGSAWAPGETHVNPNTPIQKFGPLFTYTFLRERRGRFESPTLFASIAWYLEDRFRAGQAVAQGLPTILVGFSFRGTLWARNEVQK